MRIKAIRKIGTIALCFIMLVGFLIVSTTVLCYEIKIKGVDNNFVDWFTQNASIDLSWIGYLQEDGHDGIKNVKRYEYIVEGIEDTIEDFFTSAFPGNARIKKVADVYKNDVLRNSLSTTVGGKTDIEYASEAVEYINEFNIYLDERKIPLVYIQLPEKERIVSYSKGTDYPVEELLLEDLFAQQMEEADIEYVNMGDYTDELSQFSLDASNHWFPKDALTTTRIISAYLNEKHDFKFDDSIYLISNYRDAFQDINGLKAKIKEDFGYEYQLLIPIESDIYNVIVNNQEQYVGSFAESILVDSSIWDTRTDTNAAIAYHATWRLNNGDYVDIVNKSGTNNDDKKILILGDSFSWPISAYLSQDVGEIVAFHPRYCSANVKAVIDEYQPDIVLWLYSEIQMGADNELNYGWVER